MQKTLKRQILAMGAHFVGFCETAALPQPGGLDLPRAVVFGVAINPNILARMSQKPTLEHHAEYHRLHQFTDTISTKTAQRLTDMGYRAQAQTTAYIQRQQQRQGAGESGAGCASPTLLGAFAGLGWTGKNGLLITERYGCGLHLGSVLTDAPFELEPTYYRDHCGECRICCDVCPGGAIDCRKWNAARPSEDTRDLKRCHETMAQRGKTLGITIAACGLCIAKCPYTRNYYTSVGRKW